MGLFETQVSRVLLDMRIIKMHGEKFAEKISIYQKYGHNLNLTLEINDSIDKGNFYKITWSVKTSSPINYCTLLQFDCILIDQLSCMNNKLMLISTITKGRISSPLVCLSPRILTRDNSILDNPVSNNLQIFCLYGIFGISLIFGRSFQATNEASSD